MGPSATSIAKCILPCTRAVTRRSQEWSISSESLQHTMQLSLESSIHMYVYSTNSCFPQLLSELDPDLAVLHLYIVVIVGFFYPTCETKSCEEEMSMAKT